MNKSQLSQLSLPTFDGPSLRKATKDISLSERLWSIKYSCKFCAVGVTMKRGKQWSSNKCLLCSQVSETVDHLFQCNGIKEERISELLSFANWMNGVGTSPVIKHLFLSTLLFQNKFQDNIADLDNDLLIAAAIDHITT